MELSGSFGLKAVFFSSVEGDSEMDQVNYPDMHESEILKDLIAGDRPRPLVLSAPEWNRLATAPPVVIPELAKLFSEPSIFKE
jgi:hypothetical protein